MTYPVPDEEGAPEVWAPPRYIRQEWMGRGHNFRITQPYRYRWWNEGVIHQMTVPVDFHHDMASVPRPVWWWISPMDLASACGPHDWLYNWEGWLPPDSHQIWLPRRGWTDALAAPGGTRLQWSRRDADRLFAAQMRAHGVDRWRRRAAYRAVRVGGSRAWTRGAKNHTGLHSS